MSPEMKFATHADATRRQEVIEGPQAQHLASPYGEARPPTSAVVTAYRRLSNSFVSV